MGTIKQGILGGFSGKVGTVIGGSWKGISYMRSQAQSVKNPRTDGQLSQRSKFALALDFLKPLTDIVRGTVGCRLVVSRDAGTLQRKMFELLGRWVCHTEIGRAHV